MQPPGGRGGENGRWVDWASHGHLLLRGGVVNALDKTIHLWGCCTGLFIIFIVQLVLIVISRSNFEGAQQSIETLASSWKTDLIFGITNDPNIPLLKDEYLDPVMETFPGTLEGCYCGAVSYMLQSSRHGHYGIRRGQCTWGNLFSGCVDLKATPPKSLNKIPGGPQMYSIKARNTSFSEVYTKMDSEGNCQKGFRNCGNKSSISKGVCVTEKTIYCPVTSISVAAGTDSQPIKVSNLTLFYRRNPQQNPLADLGISESHVCFSRGVQPISPDRDRYVLLKGTSTNCIADGSAQNLTVFGEEEFFKANNFTFQQESDIDIHNKWRHAIYVGRPIEWSPRCKTLVPTLLDTNKELQPLLNSYNTATILFIVVTVISLVCLFTLCACIPCSWAKKSSVILLSIPITMFLISLYSFVSSVRASPNFPTIPESCTTQQAHKTMTDTFEFMHTEVLSKLYWAYGIMTFGILGSLIFGYMIWQTVSDPQLEGGVRVGGAQHPDDEEVHPIVNGGGD